MVRAPTRTMSVNLFGLNSFRCIFFPHNSAEFWAILGKFKENNDCMEISWPDGHIWRPIFSYMTSYLCFHMYW